MSEPVRIDPARFLEFIGTPGLALLFVSVHPGHPFNRTLGEVLSERYAEELVQGTIDILDLILWAGPALPFLQRGLRACGAPNVFGVVPGYWLLRGGQVIAWDSGLPTTEDARAMEPGEWLALIWSGFSRDLALIGQTLHAATEVATARRIALSFAQAVGDQTSGERPPPPPPPPSSVDELIRAYRILGVSPYATDREVNDAWRKRRAENHPDRAAQDPVEFERRSRISVEINCARDLIMNHRAGGRRRPAA